MLPARLRSSSFTSASSKYPTSAACRLNPAILPEQLVTIADAYDERIDAAQHRVNAIQPLDFPVCIPALGDVLRDAGDPIDLAVVAIDRERAIAYPSNCAIGSNDAIFLD